MPHFQQLTSVYFSTAENREGTERIIVFLGDLSVLCG